MVAGNYQHNEQARTALKFSLTLMPVIWAYVESRESVVNLQIAACSLVLLLCRVLGFSRAGHNAPLSFLISVLLPDSACFLKILPAACGSRVHPDRVHHEKITSFIFRRHSPPTLFPLPPSIGRRCRSSCRRLSPLRPRHVLRLVLPLGL